MKIKYLIAVASASIMAIGCVDAIAAAKVKLVRLPSGAQIKFCQSTTITSDDHKTQALMCIYQTNKNIKDRKALAKEADDIWDLFGGEVERYGLGSAVISANTEACHFDRLNQGYNFLLDKGADGQWRCATDNIVGKGSPAKIYYRQAKQLFIQRDYKRALTYYNKSIKLNPSYAQAYVERGGIYAHLNQPDQALPDLNRAIGLNPDSGQAYYYRSLAQGKLGKNNLADADRKKARALGYRI